MDEETRPTVKHIQPYQYYKLTGERVAIKNPSGAIIKLHRSDIQRKLSGEDITLRDMSAHERVMLETAWAVLEGKAK